MFPETVCLGDELTIRRLGFGTVRLTGPGVWGPPPDRDASKALLRQAVDAGVNFLDTADSYGPHVVEELVSEALYPYPPDLVIATKGGLKPSGPGNFDRDARPQSLRRCCQDSLRRLRLERIDLYQLHAVDPKVPFEESIGALNELRAEGLIRMIGLSNVIEAEIWSARTIAPIASIQNCYNVVDRDSDRIVEECERTNTVFLPWFPLARGHLSEGDGVLATLARRRGVQPAQIALAWLLQRSRIVAPIPGTNNPDHLAINIAATTIELELDELDELDRIDATTEPLTADPATRRVQS